ncbi:MAG TPA: WXG100 family type VII secretion target [Syntrophomonadaceae bacterium]|nr:WXG100 family type VII secretion target [Syntrophomonadaceae bacterium]
MANIQITPDLLTGKSGELRKLIADHTNTMTQITNLVHGLGEIWKGDAQTAFNARFDQAQSQIKAFADNLESYAKLMDEAAKEFSTTDTQLKSTMSSFGA